MSAYDYAWSILRNLYRLRHSSTWKGKKTFNNERRRNQINFGKFMQSSKFFNPCSFDLLESSRVTRRRVDFGKVKSIKMRNTSNLLHEGFFFWSIRICCYCCV